MSPSRTIRKPGAIIAAVVFAAGAILTILWATGVFTPPPERNFSGEQAYTYVLRQMSFGPRITGTQGNLDVVNYIVSELEQADWQTEIQTFTYRDTPVRNVIGRANTGKGPIVILGAHYDTRRRADQDYEHPNDPVPGANDGASGVAVLLELAHCLDLRRIPHELWLAFFDAEDNGELDGWDWIVGSTYMAENLTVEVAKMILVDMVGDADQKFYLDMSSDEALSLEIWAVGIQLGYGEQFQPTPVWSMIDDHTPFARRGIPAVCIIDFQYPHWHKITDTADKVSPQSLERIGRTLEVYLERTIAVTPLPLPPTETPWPTVMNAPTAESPR